MNLQLLSKQILVATGLLVLATQLWATTVIAVSSTDLVERADSIVHGTCESATTFRDDKGQIMTRYKFRVHECFKGADDGTLEFVQPGGELDGQRLVIPGLAGYEVDAEAFLFLTAEYGEDRRLPIGLDQGVYHVVTPKNGGAPRVRRNIAALSFVESEPDKVQSFPDNVSVGKFRAAVDTKVEELSE